MEPWPFTDPPNVAAVTVRQITHGGAPILLVSHDLDEGDWQFLTGGVFDVSDGLLVTLRSMVERDHSLAELADLPLGWQAQREQTGSCLGESSCRPQHLTTRSSELPLVAPLSAAAAEFGDIKRPANHIEPCV